MDIPKAAHGLYTMTDRKRLRLQVCWPQDIVRRGTEVREGDTSILLAGDEDVAGLDVAVNDIPLVQLGDTEDLRICLVTSRGREQTADLRTICASMTLASNTERQPLLRIFCLRSPPEQ